MIRLKRTVSVILAIIFICSCFVVLPLASNAAKQYSLGEKGLALIKKYEGFNAYAYPDYSHWSIGYGTPCGQYEYPNGITEPEAAALLAEKMVSYEQKLDDFLTQYNIKVNQNQYDALVSLTYNLGNPWKKYDEFDLKTILINGVEKYSAQEIKDAFGVFCKAGGQVLSGLVKRRAAEAELFLTPVADSKPVCSLFDDVRDNAWYFPAVKYVYQNGLIAGISADLFAPKEALTRSMAVTVIAKLSAKNISGYTASPFSDVAIGKWYAQSVAWAYENNIVSGVGGGLFDPNSAVTRQDFMLLLYNYAVRFGLTSAQEGILPVGFADSSEVSGYAVNAVSFAIRSGLLSGDNDGNLDPKGETTRAQTAQIIMKFKEIYG
ncbi:MAG: S-layer homology domain-containing protein [Clostridia bacterium]|nr:S-layer homology domain-containing protein [Clostridia bacterium]